MPININRKTTERSTRMRFTNPLNLSNELPEGQKLITTSSMQRFETCMKLAIESRKTYPTMAAVTGWPGLGKTISVLAFKEQLGERPNTGLPACVSLRVKSRSTSRALAIDWLHAMGERPRGRNVYDLGDEICQAIEASQPDIVILEEGDLLDTDSFELVRYVFDTTKCPVVVVGLPSIMRVIYQHDKFASRVGIRMGFRALQEQEVLNTVLPNLTFPGWQFDPEKDRELGKLVWSWVKPSLRDLRNLLQAASITTVMKGGTQITKTILRGAARTIGAAENQRKRGRRIEDEADLANEAGSYEKASEQRNEEKGRKKRD
jgi:DNA transposition AAA+ family ATPase